MGIPLLKNISAKSKRVFLRADLNNTIQGVSILQDFRLQATLPTIKYLQENGCKVILATHIGRPKKDSFDEKLSTQILVSWFKENGFNIRFEQDFEKAQTLSTQNINEILLLENLRFFTGEKGEKKERIAFATTLKELADVYVNDAFALMHRDDCSVTNLPQTFEPSKRVFGLLVQKEIEVLSSLKENVAQPFIIILGGNKIKSKIPLLQNFLKKPETIRPKHIIIGGAIAYTFLKAQGYNVGNSLVENEHVAFAKHFLNDTKSKNINILLPSDHLVAQNITHIKEINAPDIKISYCKTEDIPKNGICVDIGPQTIEAFCNVIKTSKTIFTNGSMGIFTKPEFATGSKEVLQAIATSGAHTVAGGGDCVAAIHLFGLQKKFTFLSTGGGATLSFLGYEDPLKEMPAAKAMLEK